MSRNTNSLAAISNIACATAAALGSLSAGAVWPWDDDCSDSDDENNNNNYYYYYDNDARFASSSIPVGFDTSAADTNEFRIRNPSSSDQNDNDDSPTLMDRQFRHYEEYNDDSDNYGDEEFDTIFDGRFHMHPSGVELPFILKKKYFLLQQQEKQKEKLQQQQQQQNAQNNRNEAKDESKVVSEELVEIVAHTDPPSSSSHVTSTNKDDERGCSPTTTIKISSDEDKKADTNDCNLPPMDLTTTRRFGKTSNHSRLRRRKDSGMYWTSEELEELVRFTSIGGWYHMQNQIVLGEEYYYEEAVRNTTTSSSTASGSTGATTASVNNAGQAAHIFRGYDSYQNMDASALAMPPNNNDSSSTNCPDYNFRTSSRKNIKNTDNIGYSLDSIQSSTTVSLGGHSKRHSRKSHMDKDGSTPVPIVPGERFRRMFDTADAHVHSNNSTSTAFPPSQRPSLLPVDYRWMSSSTVGGLIPLLSSSNDASALLRTAISTTDVGPKTSSGISGTSNHSPYITGYTAASAGKTIPTTTLLSTPVEPIGTAVTLETINEIVKHRQQMDSSKRAAEAMTPVKAQTLAIPEATPKSKSNSKKKKQSQLTVEIDVNHNNHNDRDIPTKTQDYSQPAISSTNIETCHDVHHGPEQCDMSATTKFSLPSSQSLEKPLQYDNDSQNVQSAKETTTALSASSASLSPAVVEISRFDPTTTTIASTPINKSASSTKITSTPASSSAKRKLRTFGTVLHTSLSQLQDVSSTSGTPLTETNESDAVVTTTYTDHYDDDDEDDDATNITTMTDVTTPIKNKSSKKITSSKKARLIVTSSEAIETPTDTTPTSITSLPKDCALSQNDVKGTKQVENDDGSVNTKASQRTRKASSVKKAPITCNITLFDDDNDDNAVLTSTIECPSFSEEDKKTVEEKTSTSQKNSTISLIHPSLSLSSKPSINESQSVTDNNATNDKAEKLTFPQNEPTTNVLKEKNGMINHPNEQNFDELNDTNVTDQIFKTEKSSPSLTNTSDKALSTNTSIDNFVNDGNNNNNNNKDHDDTSAIDTLANPTSNETKQNNASTMNKKAPSSKKARSTLVQEMSIAPTDTNSSLVDEEPIAPSRHLLVPSIVDNHNYDNSPKLDNKKSRTNKSFTSTKMPLSSNMVTTDEISTIHGDKTTASMFTNDEGEQISDELQTPFMTHKKEASNSFLRAKKRKAIPEEEIDDMEAVVAEAAAAAAQSIITSLTNESFDRTQSLIDTKNSSDTTSSVKRKRRATVNYLSEVVRNVNDDVNRLEKRTKDAAISGEERQHFESQHHETTAPDMKRNKSKKNKITKVEIEHTFSGDKEQGNNLNKEDDDDIVVAALQKEYRNKSTKSKKKEENVSKVDHMLNNDHDDMNFDSKVDTLYDSHDAYVTKAKKKVMTKRKLGSIEKINSKDRYYFDGKIPAVEEKLRTDSDNKKMLFDIRLERTSSSMKSKKLPTSQQPEQEQQQDILQSKYNDEDHDSIRIITGSKDKTKTSNATTTKGSKSSFISSRKGSRQFLDTDDEDDEKSIAKSKEQSIRKQAPLQSKREFDTLERSTKKSSVPENFSLHISSKTKSKSVKHPESGGGKAGGNTKKLESTVKNKDSSEHMTTSTLTTKTMTAKSSSSTITCTDHNQGNMSTETTRIERKSKNNTTSNAPTVASLTVNSTSIINSNTTTSPSNIPNKGNSSSYKDEKSKTVPSSVSILSSVRTPQRKRTRK